jgi:hypothetical protein
VLDRRLLKLIPIDSVTLSNEHGHGERVGALPAVLVEQHIDHVEGVADGPEATTWRGLQVQVILAARQTAPAPDPTGPHGVLAYARLLYPLGPDPAHWTASLLRWLTARRKVAAGLLQPQPSQRAAISGGRYHCDLNDRFVIGHNPIIPLDSPATAPYTCRQLRGLSASPSALRYWHWCA